MATHLLTLHLNYVKFYLENIERKINSTLKNNSANDIFLMLATGNRKSLEMN